ncbi:hypothetical protein JTB14_022483 [Gonioctena quinquepunctata]|nr:hypothetical protein JTB14_022483 [Gonioctena quinquepunctata]
MAHRMQVNRLAQDELEYELKVRGTGTAEEMRHSLAMAIRLEKSGDSLEYPAYPYTIEEDEKAIGDKLAAHTPMVEGYEPDSADRNLLQKLQSKLAHVLHRIDNLDEEGSTERPRFRAATLSLMNSLLQQSENTGKDGNVPPHLSFLEQSIVFNPARRSSSTSPNRVNLPSTSSQAKTILPIKWDVKFSGDKKGPSLSAFLERVEELRQADTYRKRLCSNLG